MILVNGSVIERRIIDLLNVLGDAIRASNIPREEIFVTTKLWNSDHGYTNTIEACNRSLKKLGLDYGEKHSFCLSFGVMLLLTLFLDNHFSGPVLGPFSSFS
jgi:hypothetical protein